MLYAYHRYIEMLDRDKARLTKYEFEYIKKRLVKVKKDFSADKHFSSGFWYHEEKKHAFNPDKLIG